MENNDRRKKKWNGCETKNRIFTYKPKNVILLFKRDCSFCSASLFANMYCSFHNFRFKLKLFLSSFFDNFRLNHRCTFFFAVHLIDMKILRYLQNGVGVKKNFFWRNSFARFGSKFGWKRFSDICALCNGFSRCFCKAHKNTCTQEPCVCNTNNDYFFTLLRFFSLVCYYFRLKIHFGL